jgi:hypothetical protein
MAYLSHADLRICLSEVPENLQLSVQAHKSQPFAGLPQVREQEVEKGNERLCDDAGIERTRSRHWR